MPAGRLGDVLAAIWECPKPVVARVGGPARAGGLGLIAAADIAVCADDATFAFTEVRLGVIPAVISATVLPRLAPRAAAELFLTGDDVRRRAGRPRSGWSRPRCPADELDDDGRGVLRGAGPRRARARSPATKELLRAHAGRDGPCATLAELTDAVGAATSPPPRAARASPPSAEKRDPALGARPSDASRTGRPRRTLSRTVRDEGGGHGA